MNEDYKPNITIDNGSGYTKAGFSGEDEPKIIIPTIVGKPKNKMIM